MNLVNRERKFLKYLAINPLEVIEAKLRASLISLKALISKASKRLALYLDIAMDSGLHLAINEFVLFHASLLALLHFVAAALQTPRQRAPSPRSFARLEKTLDIEGWDKSISLPTAVIKPLFIVTRRNKRKIES